jgi:hypothetical protein
VCLATGGGKSLIFSFVAAWLRGVVFVFEPTISVIADQLLDLPPCVQGYHFTTANLPDKSFKSLLKSAKPTLGTSLLFCLVR